MAGIRVKVLSDLIDKLHRLADGHGEKGAEVKVVKLSGSPDLGDLDGHDAPMGEGEDSLSHALHDEIHDDEMHEMKKPKFMSKHHKY